MTQTDDLADIRAREAAATPGPWGWRGNVDNDDPRLTSFGYAAWTGSDGRKIVSNAGDVIGHVPVERTRAEAIRLGVGSLDGMPEVSVADEPADTYDERLEAAEEAAREAAIADWLTSEYGEPRTDRRLAFCTDWLYTPARDLVIYEVAPGARSRDDRAVYRADITGIRHPDAEFIAHSRADIPRLLAVIDDMQAQLGASEQVNGSLTITTATGTVTVPTPIWPE